MIKTLIVEDNQKSAELLKDYLKNLFNDLEVIGIAQTINEAVEFIYNYKPILVFLDINLKTESGFDIFDKTNAEEFEVIVTTAYSEHALKALKKSAVDYILKPFNSNDLKEAVAKAKKIIELKEHSRLSKNNKSEKLSDRIFISTVDGLIFVEIKDIVSITADSNYSEFIMANGSKLISSKRLAVYEEMLKNHSFVRVHKSYIVNLKHIKKFQRGRCSCLYMSNGTIVKVSENKKEELLNSLMV